MNFTNFVSFNSNNYSKLSILYFNNKLLVFTNNYNQIVYFKHFFHKFLIYKGINFNCANFFSYSIFDSFFFLHWKFQKSFNDNIISQSSNTCLRQYKCHLKLFIKNSLNIKLFPFLQKINSFIIKWRVENNYSNSFFLVAFKLDIYLYRLIWKWAKRKHPRRNNSWIYSKYWKSFSGVWKFFAIDLNTGQLAFLTSHFSIKSKRLSSLPRSLKIFDLNNYQKLNAIWFNKSRLNFHTLYRFLWNKQKGVCSSCLKPINYFDFTSIKIFNSLKSLKVIDPSYSKFFLIHNSCEL